MATEALPSPDRSAGPANAADAARALAEIAPVQQRSRRVARRRASGVPMVAWGAASLVGTALLSFLASPWGAVLGTAGCVVAAAVTFGIRPGAVRSGHEGRFAAGWSVLVACSLPLAVIVSPAGSRTLAIFLTALWGTALAVYGTAVGDPALALVGAVTLLAGAASQAFWPDAGIVVTGGAAGVAMLALGVVRLSWRPERQT